MQLQAGCGDGADDGTTLIESGIEPAEVGRHRSLGPYDLGEVLGEGGMAVVYRAKNVTTGQDIALKQLVVGKHERSHAESVALFEREFHTLAELSHPRIIEVYDYGVGDAGPYYTMELLDGGDLRERSPIPWRLACTLAYDVCSSLALLHSRRLVHRDISPRNIRCTKDGRAKLIDFGAMVPMGIGALIVGTPAFIAPEVVNRSVVDARTDLFSLGATLYFALTGAPAFSARSIGELAGAWAVKPPPPSRIVAGIPAALDDLVLSLVAVDPASRPRTSFEVMQQLAVIGRVERVEPKAVSRAYLSTPTMVARDDTMARLRHQLRTTVDGRGGAVLVRAEGGMGRSRVLDACAIEAKTLGATVLRASGTAAGKDPFGVAQALAEQLCDARPEVALAAARDEGVDAILLRDPAGAGGSPVIVDLASERTRRFEFQTALSRWISRISSTEVVVMVVDDVHRIDEPSAALLATLAARGARDRLLIATSTDPDVDPTDFLAHDVITRSSTVISLQPLDAVNACRLFESIFGDVPNVATVAHGVFSVASGNPRTMMEVAQHLVDRGVIRYEAGRWILPARLEAADLPGSAAATMQARLDLLSDDARRLAQAHALASHDTFTRDDYARLGGDRSAREVDAAITDLLEHQVIVGDGRVYVLSHSGWKAALGAPMDEEARAGTHRSLARLYEARSDMARVRHLLPGRQEAAALDVLFTLMARAEPEATGEYSDMRAAEVAEIFERALSLSGQLGRTPREVCELRRWLVSLSVATDDRHYWNAAPAWLEQLKRDSGHDSYGDMSGTPAERLMRSMGIAYERHMSMPEAERGYRPDQAVRGLVQYVAVSIAIGARTFDLALIDSLPPLLEPFAPMSPIVHAIWQNALATQENMCRGRPEAARDRWAALYDRLGEVTGDDAQWVALIRRAVAYGVGSVDAWMGRESATEWAERMTDDALQVVSAVQLKRVVRLQQGDWSGAERLRRQGEVLALQARARQMFTSLSAIELGAQMLARDVTGIKESVERIDALASRSPGWVPFQRVARGCFALTCGDFETALAEFTSALDLVLPDAEHPFPLHSALFRAAFGATEALVGLGRSQEARERGKAWLSSFRGLGIGRALHDLSRAVALAEAKVGEHEQAFARLDTVLQNQLSMGTTGLHLGATYEALARVAIEAGDRDRLADYARLTAKEYRHGQDSPLGARYERLLEDARRAGHGAFPSLAEFRSADSALTAVD